MNSSIKESKIFNIFKKRNENKKSKGKVKQFFDQLSRGLMLPIAILPIAGLLLGIGGSIGANVTSETGIIFANIFKGMSDVIFGNLPILFCIAITITFSKDKGASGFAAVLAYLVFASSQS
ncbi:MAG: PTS transporter subunit EIIC, partial [Metamycoplasmataceae bacterium]